MPPSVRTASVFAFQALVCAGALAVTSAFSDPSVLKAPLMLAGILGLLPALAFRLKSGVHLLPGLLLFAWLYGRLTPGDGQHAAAIGLLAAAAAFLLGIARVPLAGVRLLIPLALLCVARGLADLVTLSHLGGEPPAGHPVTSFFGDKHVLGGVLALAAFLHFHLMERGGPQKPVQALLYTSALATLLALVLCDSRAAQGAFLLCFLPLLFLTLRLDGREPGLERLGWIAGITLCLGLAWINLPEGQLRRAAEAVSPSEPGRVHQAWAAALETWEANPLAGAGVGGFRYAAAQYRDAAMQPAGPDLLPVTEHAQNHLFQVLAEGGGLAASLELYLLLIALLGMAVIYFRENRLQAKYGFFCLAVLSLLGMSTSALDKAPLSIAYWALVGYGWSFALEALPRWLLPHRAKVPKARRRDRWVGALTCAALACLSLWHLYQRGRELKSDRLFLEAQSLAGVNPRASTDLLAESLAWNKRNVEANYSYARVLAFFRRGEDAVKRVEYVQHFAPDSLRAAEVLAAVYGILGRHELAAREARRVLSRYPDNLAANEALAEALRHARACDELESFRAGAARLEAAYPMPRAREYTIASLDSLIGSNRDLNFLQRWFAGERLRKRYVEGSLQAYNREVQRHRRVLALRKARCPAPEQLRPEGGEPASPIPSPALLDGAPFRWDQPRAVPAPAAPRPKRRYKGRILALPEPEGLPRARPRPGMG